MGPRPRPPAARRQRRRWRLVAVMCALLVVSRSGPDTIGGATADVGGDHLTASGVEVGDSLEFYDYGDATPVSAPGDTAWNDGAFAGARSDLVPDTLTLDHYGTVPADPAEPWWDDAWRSRRCFDVDHTTAGATTEDGYQVRLLIDTQTPLAAGEFDVDAQDLRAARHDGGGFIDLDLWVEPGTLDSLATVVWVQLDQLTAGVTTDLCLYWNNPDPVPVASDQAAVFTYSGPQTLYYTVSDAYGPGTDRVDLAPLVAGTQISLDGSTPAVSLTVAPGDGTVTVAADVTAPHAAVVRSTNGVPFLLTHRSDVGGDAVVGVPAATDDLVGVQSQQARLGYGAAGGDADVQRSDGTEELVSGTPDDSDVFGPSPAAGAGPGVRITALDVASGALQQDDGDGGESTSFWPIGELGDRYLVPIDAEHVVAVCPVAGTEISIGGSPAVACGGTDFGGDFIGRAVDATGWTVTTDAVTVASTGGEPFWLSFDRGSGTGADDEVQVGSWRQARQVTFPAPSLTARPEEGRFRPAGRWDSAPVDTGADGVFGLLRWAATLPADTAVRFQLASGDTQLASVLSPFVGPDGTDATFYTASATPAAYAHDDDRWVRIRADLLSTDPTATPEIASVTLDTRLAALGSTLDDPTVLAVNSPAGVPTSAWLARVHTLAPTFAGSTTTLRSANAPVVPGVDAATVSFARPDAVELIVAAETVFQPTGPPVAFAADAPHSIVVDSTVSGPATFDFTWSTLVGGSSPVVEHRFRLEFSG